MNFVLNYSESNWNDIKEDKKKLSSNKRVQNNLEDIFRKQSKTIIFHRFHPYILCVAQPQQIDWSAMFS